MAIIVTELVFVGLGLHDEYGISLRGLEEAKTAHSVFIELYTSLMPGLSLANLSHLIGKTLETVTRRQIEEENGKVVLSSAREGKTVLIVPGDPLMATTHVALRIEAEKQGIRTRVVHGASVISAVIGLSGLHNYKFGKSVTIPFAGDRPSETPYETIRQNRVKALHTLCLLDIDAEQHHYLKIADALKILRRIEEKKKQKIIQFDTLAVGIARAGSLEPTVKADFVDELINYDFGGPPQTLVFPGKLHFMEAEALITLAHAPDSVRRMIE